MKVKNIKCKDCKGSILQLLDKEPTVLQRQEIQKHLKNGHTLEKIDMFSAKMKRKCTCFKK